MEDGPVIGIDFGTTNTAVAYIDGAGKCIQVPFGQEKFIFPSTITIGHQKWSVGVHKSGQQPKNVKFGFLTKRALGRKSTDGKLRKDLEGLPFHLYTTEDLFVDGQYMAGRCKSGISMRTIIETLKERDTDPDGIENYLTELIEAELAELLTQDLCAEDPQHWATLLDDFFITEPMFEAAEDEVLYPEELAAQILMKAKRAAEAHIGKPIKRCVIAIPAYFTHAQRQAIRDAAVIAGLDVRRLVNEPSAAAIAYAQKCQLRDGKYLVADLGGGTFDVSLLHIEDQTTKKAYVVKATGGDNCLGGEDFTRILMDMLYEGTGLSKNDAEIAREVRSAAETVKERLVDEEEVDIDVCGEESTVTAQDFLDRCQPIFRRIRDIICDTLKKQRELIQKQADEGEAVEKVCESVLLNGGATFTRGYRETLREATRERIEPPQDVSVLASQGAAFLGADRAVLTEVLGSPLGIMTTDDKGTYYMSVIMRRNEPLPRMRKKKYKPSGDFDEAMRITLLQGENRLAKDNIHLGWFEIELPGRPRDESWVEVTILANPDESIQVTACLVGDGSEADGPNLKVVAASKFDDEELRRLKEKNLNRLNTRSLKRPRENDDC